MSSLKHKVIAWDFDGVLNANMDGGIFLWMTTFEQDTGLSMRSLASYLFSGRFQKAMVGEADLHELVGDWAEKEGVPHRAGEVIDYWFDKDHIPDTKTLDIVRRAREAGAINVIATNNEAYRAAFIEEKGFGEHMHEVFAAGRMCLAKPDLAYFKHIEDALGYFGKDVILIDDFEENVDAARRHGWDAHLFTPNNHDAVAKAIGLAGV
ncbi:HAD family hydrolase [Henriciella aquimarina]|uniref:HAD family hydrolase n=1 Tax=Henriciella aquimarina TaxID=545261 RepID=UPI000A07B237|nr:HAD family hydrolase [Henriciella aquimarina]